jgi:hypothetical protein
MATRQYSDLVVRRAHLANDDRVTHVLEQGRSKAPILCNTQKHHSSSTSGLARDRDFLVIAYKLFNVVAHPLKCECHAQDTRIDDAI